MRIAKVYIEHPVANLDFPFDYFVTPQTDIKVGVRVEIEFNNRLLVGYVEDVVEEDYTLESYQEKFGYSINPILRVIDSEPLLNAELRELAHFVAKKTVSPVIACYQTLLPPTLKPSSTKKVGIKKLKVVKVIDEDIDTLTKPQTTLLSSLVGKETFLKDIKQVAMVKRLEEFGKVKIYDKEVYRSPYDFSGIEKIKGPVLSPEQKQVIDTIKSSGDSIFLLEGVTGSGKTEIYINLAIETLKQGKNVLILVPEISLTPAMIKRFAERISEGIAVLHSLLSPGEKYDEYRRIARGEARVVIGARSAAFAPLSNIGLIVVDEEHSESYKQDNVPSYHVLDVILERQKTHQSKLILGSATPSLESKARAVKGLYHQLYLTKRINDVPLPKVTIVNMLEEAQRRNFGLFSDLLRRKIQETIDNGKQVILLLNRRGYAVSMNCPKCGYVYKCPSCGVALHYHRSDEKLKCHYCGYEINKPSRCPECGNTYLRISGVGTQKVEEMISKEFTNAKVIRMDVDSVRNKGGHQKILDAFESGEYNILLGTQMIAKGLDFPNVMLVGVLNADTSLYCGDFRANERTFQLLTQVVGRSGRGSEQGEAIIQTYNYDNYSIALAAKQDYSAFFKMEMQYRHQMLYPPYRYLANLMLYGSNKDRTFNYAVQIKDFIKQENIDPELVILGPAEPYIPLTNNKYRYRIMLKYKDQEGMMKLLGEVKNYSRAEKIEIHFDINPYNDI